MLKQLRAVDPDLLEIVSGDGHILVSAALQGRIFCEIGGELIHQFLPALAAAPDPENFNNIGGNSLWPAPEGGAFAFNYPPRGEWYVQPAINRQAPEISEHGAGFAVVGKDIELLNRAGKRLQLRWERRVEAVKRPEFPVGTLAYHTVDVFSQRGALSFDEAPVAAWSLEQLPGADGAVAFGRCAGKAEECINDDFYGNPHPKLRYEGNFFRFELGGTERLQIGVRASAAPELIGSFDAGRGVAVLRFTPERSDGKRINIADNDQPRGIESAADMFSIFNGGTELNFHELETIAPVSVDSDGRVIGSRLESDTVILKGKSAEVGQLLNDLYGVPETFFSA